ncbi:uncharacterized protein LOC135392707 isoform X2 [Ornithodoros turicata]|uniref:uncharacterized protein LOC135392707 isoform X2 n=1 Tax=Ornithodoros turicata TaxID=34597 RepID=UPI00313A32AA
MADLNPHIRTTGYWSPGMPLASPSALSMPDRRTTTVAVGATVFSVVFAVLVVSALSYILYKAMHSPRRIQNVSAFCCPDILESLYFVMNRSKDPCQDFYQYTCYAWRENRTSAAPIVEDGHSGSSPSAKAIGQYYSSCIRHALRGIKHVVTSAVRAIISIVPDLSFNSPQAVILKSMMVLSSEYYLFFLINFFYVPHSKRRNAHLSISVYSVFISDEAVATEALVVAIAVTNRHFNANVSVNDVMTFIHEVERRLPTGHSTTTSPAPQHSTSRSLSKNGEVVSKVQTTKFSDLSSLLPSVPQETWEWVYKELRYSTNSEAVVTGASVVNFILESYTNIRWRPAATTLLVILTASVIDTGLWDLARTKDALPAQKCAEVTNDLTPLWDNALTIALTSDEKDSAVRTVFDKTVNAIRMEAISRTHGQSAVRLLNSIISSITLLLPSDRDPPVFNLTLAKDTDDQDVGDEYVDASSRIEDYCANAFAVLRYWVYYDRYQAISSLIFQFFKGREVYNTSVNIIGGYLYVPPVTYALLSFRNNTDRLINLAILGTQIADATWSYVINSFKSQGGTTAEWDLLKCSDPNALLRGRVSEPWLSTWITAKVAMTDAWYLVMDGWGTMKVSPSQVFYMLVFYHHVCSSEINVARGQRLSQFMSTLADFNRAFNCPMANATSRCDTLVLHSSTESAM